MTTAEQIYHEAGTLSESMRNDVLAYIQQLKQKLTTSSVELKDKPTEQTENEVEMTQLSEKQRKLYDIMNRMSKQSHAYQGIDAMAWQKEQRQDKILAFRDE